MRRPKEILAMTTPHVAGDEDSGRIKRIVGFDVRLAHGAVYRDFTETFSHRGATAGGSGSPWSWRDPCASVAPARFAQFTTASRRALQP
jgi:hypothetical protein